MTLVAPSCGDDGRARLATDDAPESNESSPFSVSEIPAGYELIVAGRGTYVPDWGDDEVGTHEPFTVLGRDGSTDAGDIVVVSTTGFEGYQGGLSQASRGYWERSEELSIDGHDAFFTPGTGEAWADLVAIAGDDVAVRVTAPGASRDELVEVLERVEVPAEQTRAPAVVDPPGDLEVVGSVDVDAVLALGPGFDPRSEHVPGPTTAHVAGWAGDEERGTLSVRTLPGDTVDIAALAGVAAFRRYGETTVEALTTEGRPTVVLEHTEVGGWTSQTVWQHTDWGDIVVVGAVGQRNVPDVDALHAMAMSVERSEPSAWDAFVVEAGGGPGLRPDRSSVEVTRGSANGVEWLLQTGLPGQGLIGSDSELTWAVDPCLKLPGRRKACTTGGAGSPTSWTTFSQGGDDGMPPFALVTTSTAAARVRVTTSTDEATAPLVPVPGTSLFAAVVVVTDPGMPGCPGTGELPDIPGVAMRVEALDAQGAVVECFGMDAGG